MPRYLVSGACTVTPTPEAPFSMFGRSLGVVVEESPTLAILAARIRWPEWERYTVRETREGTSS